MVRSRAAMFVLVGACDAGTTPAPQPEPEADADTHDGCSFFCSDATGPIDYDAGTYTPDAIPPPPQDCSDSGRCTLPPSVCVAASVLEYFDNATCVDGGCQFEIKFHYCDECVDGGCISNHTAPVPP